MNLNYNKAMDSVVMDTNAENTWEMVDANNLRLLGTDVRVAIIDSGIDWTHPSFYNPITSTSWPVMFDKSGNSYLDFNPNGKLDAGELLNYEKVDVSHPNGTILAEANTFDVGIDYLYLDINNDSIRDSNEPFFLLDDRNMDNKLSPKDFVYALVFPKIEKIFDVKNNFEYLRGVNLTDPVINTQRDYNGHGTHVAGIIAGGNPGFTKFTGIAPNVTLLIAKAIDDSTNLFPENYVISAIDWAIKENADIISISLGGFDDRFLDGSDNLDLKIDEAQSHGISVVVSAGNNANKKTHAEVLKTSLSVISPVNPGLPSPLDVEWTLLPFSSGGEEFGNNLEVIRFTILWREPHYNSLFEITMPDGTSFSIPKNTTSLTISDINDADQYVIFSKLNQSSRGTNKQYIEVRKASGAFINSNPPSNGDTEFSNPAYQQSAFLRINAASTTSLMNQEFQIYISDNRGGGKGIFTKFVNTNQISADHTVTSPATADSAISVGSFITKDSNINDSYYVGDISAFSSRGNRIDGKQMPLITAPGEYVFSASSKDAYQYPRYSFVSKMGTSMAAPVVSGSIALLKQFRPTLSMELIKSLLFNSTNIDTFVSIQGAVPNNVFGYGKLNISRTVENARSPIIDSVNIPRYYSNGSDIPISVIIKDISGVNNVKFAYSKDGGLTWNELTPILNGASINGTWSAKIPQQSGVHLLVQIKAEDKFGFTMISPFFIIAESNNSSNIVSTVTSNATITETSTVTSVVTVTNGNVTSQTTSSNSDSSFNLNALGVGVVILLIELLHKRKVLLRIARRNNSP